MGNIPLHRSLVMVRVQVVVRVLAVVVWVLVVVGVVVVAWVEIDIEVHVEVEDLQETNSEDSKMILSWKISYTHKQQRERKKCSYWI